MNSFCSHTLLTSYLKVPGNHELYYEIFGNPNGIPILFLQGYHEIGLAANDYKVICDPAKFKIVALDQRGAGKSKPMGEIENNTTHLLIDDINVLLQKLNIKNTFLAGSDNSSILALAYAIKNPYRILGIFLGGVFSENSQKSAKHYVNGGLKSMLPREWFRFQKPVPRDKKRQITKYYLGKMLSSDLKTADKYAFEWAKYKISVFNKDVRKNEIAEIIKNIPYRVIATVETHYLSNNYFLEDNYILDHADMLDHIPAIIYCTNYDINYYSIFARKLHKKLAKSKLIINNGNCSQLESTIAAILRTEVEQMVSTYT